MVKRNIKKILIVEDDEAISELMKIVLESRGYEVFTARDASHAYKLAFYEIPDLILLDLWIPGESGEELAARFKKHAELRDVPVLLVSAQTNLPTIVKKIGANGYISKPFDLDVFAATVAKYV